MLFRRPSKQFTYGDWVAVRVFDSGDGASKRSAWFSGSGNDFGCATDGGGKNLDVSLPGASKLPEGSTITARFKSY